MEYFIEVGSGVTAKYAIANLVDRVREMVKQGWIPNGSVTITSDDRSYVAMQPMVKDENNGESRDSGKKAQG